VDVSDSELGYIIGRSGQTIKSIQGDTNTKIYTPVCLCLSQFMHDVLSFSSGTAMFDV